MPIELIKDFIDKRCCITLMTSTYFEITGIVKSVEGYWIKVQEDDSLRLVNGALIRDIKVIE